MNTRTGRLSLLAVVALILGLTFLGSGNAQRVATALPAPIITGIPAGIVNPADICNGWYPDVCPVPFDDRNFQDQLEWVLDELAGAGVSGVAVSFSALKNGCGPEGECIPYTPTLITLTRAEGFDTFTTGVREVLRGAEAVRIGALQAFSVQKSAIALKWYPGYEARHPSQGNPIGEPWPEHPYAKNGWKMYHPSAADSDAKFPVGGLFLADQRKFRKWRFVLKQGSGPFGTGGTFANAWEEVTLR